MFHVEHGSSALTEKNDVIGVPRSRGQAPIKFRQVLQDPSNLAFTKEQHDFARARQQWPSLTNQSRRSTQSSHGDHGWGIGEIIGLALFQPAAPDRHV